MTAVIENLNLFYGQFAFNGKDAHHFLGVNCVSVHWARAVELILCCS